MSFSPISQKTVVAIDLGSTLSGISVFPTTSPSPETITHTNEGGTSCSKTRTCVLYDQNLKLDSIGYVASKKYFELSNELKSQYYFVTDMKKALFQSPSEHTEIEENGHSFNVVQVLIDFVKELAKMAFDKYPSLRPFETKWVATVPANWEQAHGDLIKYIFYQAGLVEDENPTEESLLILLEPEAAAAFISEECKSTFSLQDGHKYMVVDCGGGTIDSTCVQIVNGKLKTSRHSDAINAGSTYLDRALLQHLQELMGQEFFQEFTSADLHILLKGWETKKLLLKDLKGDGRIPIPLTREIPILKEIVNSENKPLVMNSCLVLKTSDLKTRVYEPLFAKICKFIESILEKNFDYNYLIFVGGFSQCKPLMDAMKDYESESQKIVTAPNVSEAVVRGAAYLGRDPSIISARRSKYIYGISVEREFNPNRDPPTRMKVNSGHSLIPFTIDKIFYTLIDQHEEITGAFVRQYQFVLNEQVPTIEVQIYRALYPVKFVDQSGCSQQATIQVNVSNLDVGDKFLVKLSLNNASTLKINVSTGDASREVSHTVVFATHCTVQHFH